MRDFFETDKNKNNLLNKIVPQKNRKIWISNPSTVISYFKFSYFFVSLHYFQKHRGENNLQIDNPAERQARVSFFSVCLKSVMCFFTSFDSHIYTTLI